MNSRSRPNRTGLLSIQFVALLFAALALAHGAIAVATALTSDSVEIALPASAALPAGITGDADDPGMHIRDGEFTSAWATVDEPTPAVRGLLATGGGCAALTQIAIALAIAHLCWRLHKGRPFGASVTRTVWLSAASLSIGSLLSQAAFGFSSWQALDELRLDLTQFPLEMHFDVVPILAGLALLLVAGAFQLGERMQRDTEGLI